MTQDRFAMPKMKASDADRDAVLAQLSESFQAGRLTVEELDDRTGQALAARTLDELDDLTNDLPGPAVSAAQPSQQPERRGSYGLRPYSGVPVGVALAAVAVVGIVVAIVGGSHGSHLWWIIPVGLLVARRVAGRGSRRRGRGFY
jgi:Domain of unknown function (DUF1707)